MLITSAEEQTASLCLKQTTYSDSTCFCSFKHMDHNPNSTDVINVNK